MNDYRSGYGEQNSAYRWTLTPTSQKKGNKRMKKSRQANVVRKSIIIMVFIGLSCLQAASAERGSGFSSGVNVGMARFFDGDLGTGFNGRAYIEYAPYIHEIAVRLSGGYLRFQDEVTIGQGTFSSTEDIVFEDIYLTGGLVYRFTRENIVPYLTANFGIYHYRKDDVSSAVGPVIDGVQVSPFDSVDSKDGNDFGLNIGGGVEYFLNKTTSIGIEVLAHKIFGEVDSEIFDITMGFRFFPLR